MYAWVQSSRCDQVLRAKAGILAPPPPGAGCGVDGVKVDVQGSSGMFGGGRGGGPAASAEYARSLEASVARSFPGTHCINCMASATPPSPQ